MRTEGKRKLVSVPKENLIEEKIILCRWNVHVCIGTALHMRSVS
jgi:hypothetical protein